MLCIVSALGFNAKAQLTDGTVYWIQDTSTGQFISQGDNWSTRAVTKDVGGLGWEAVYVSDGVYKLKNIMWNTVRNENRGLGSDLYVDNGTPAEFTLTASGDGYLISLNGNYWVNNGTENAYKEKPLGTTTGAATASVWKFLTKTEYDAAIQAYKDGKAASYATTLGYTASTVSELEDIILDVNQFITKDYTSSITNPTLSTNDNGWSHNKVSQRSEGWNVGDGCAEFWNGCGSCTQTVSNLPNGLYKVTFVGSYRPANKAEALTLASEKTSSPAFVYANDAKVEFLHWIDVPAQANGRGGITVANGYQNSFYTYVTDGTLALGVVADGYTEVPSWTTFGQFTLTYYTDQVSDDDATALLASVPTGKMSDATQTTLDAAVSAFEANKTIANFNTLNAAIAKANISVAEYTTISSGVIPTNVMTGWSKTTPSGDFHVNTWSTEGNTDGSDMTTPFIENWVSSGNKLGAGKVFYEFTDLNPGETYVVTARVRLFNEAGTGVTGGTYFVGSSTKNLATFGSPCVGDFAQKGRFAVLSCASTVDDNGHLQFGVEIGDNSPINWMAIKDVTIAEGTGDVPTAIELSKTSVSLTTGSADKLTATITPATADDKTIIWSSSDESVVSVSGGNIVALKAGTATITAEAYAGNNVTASCTVTVADAAAPTYYSETITAGDYYIMNAATGTFLGGANLWGTQASVIEHGIPFGVTVGEGVYTLDSYTYNNANDHYFSGTYVDGGSTNLYITSLGNGKFSISTASGSAFVTALAGSTVVANTAENTDSHLAQWYFLSKNDRDKALTAATAENPVDATYYIKQANISRNRSAGGYGVNAWNPYSNEGGDNSNFNFYKENAAVNVWQTIDGIPNGTYTLKMQGCTTGSAVLWANEASVNILANDGDITNQATASAAFSAGKYVNTVDVTVTNRKLSITVKSDDTDKVTAFDNFELYLKSYAPVTAITAVLDKDEIQIGQTAQITTTSTPAAASFNAPTSYTSSDESVATVDANGVVTGVAVGTATITVVANEMENNSTTVDITVTLVTPTAFALSETEVDLDKDNTSATLTIVPTPDGANTAATWVSSDETVATVADGVVTAVSTGTATITATSTIDTNVSAQAIVTVTFPETAVVASTYTNNGATRTVATLGDNLIKNGAFEYPNNFYGWTTGSGGAMSADNFNLITDGDNHFITAKGHTGASGANSVGTGWAIEAGKTYVFGYKVKSTSAGNSEFHVVSLTNTLGTETTKVSKTETAVGTDWTDVAYTFTNPATDGYSYVQFRARWLNSAVSFDDFYLCEATTTTEGNVQYALDAIPTANIGEGIFQYSQAAIDAANALVQGTATVADVEAAYEAVTTLNAPEAEKRYALTILDNGKAWDGNAVTFIAGARSDQGGYGIKYFAPANKNLAQALKLTHVSGNRYKLSIKTAAGNEQYMTTAKLGYNTGANEQIRTTDDISKALEVEIRATANDGEFQLFNTAANKVIANNDNNDVYTSRTANFTIAEAEAASIVINTTAAGWGTTMLPFAVASLPDGVKAYTCAEVDNTKLTLVEVTALEANKPYIIEGAWDETLTGDAQGTALTYTEDLLTGVYAAQAIPVGSYGLQDQGEGAAFYKVEAGLTKQITANHAYLTVPSSNGVKAFYFGDTETAIKSVFDGVAAGDIYDLNGRKVTRMQKGGIYVVNGRKVMVK